MIGGGGQADFWNVMWEPRDGQSSGDHHRHRHHRLGVGDVCFFLTMRCFNDAMFSLLTMQCFERCFSIFNDAMF